MAVNGEENDSKQTDNKEVSEIKMKFRKELTVRGSLQGKQEAVVLVKYQSSLGPQRCRQTHQQPRLSHALDFGNWTLSRYEIYGSVYVK
ncbi:hypothetical protein [Peribacillus frigoritolerans]|uniref:hypothetical protein n=1 Tax=Peribacillus frigoritolerans TaxID=450367 RepID=UPI00227FEFBD|nr:hypothetical protein [Peribacillus frigoritolerans]MCY8937577.1 hypothetical protein [Peribacillus frigoritolerans]